MIHRGVSLYSYQQEQFFKRMTLRDMFRELHEELHATGVEMISQQTIPHYPTPSDEFVEQWHALCEEFQLKPITMDLYNDVLQFRDHVMSHEEVSELFSRDIELAAKLGFQNVRCCLGVPVDCMIGALPAAEKFNVRIGREIHHPYRFEDSFVDEIMEHIAKTGTKHLGLIPDMGMFQLRLPRIQKENMIRQYHLDPDSMEMVDEMSARYATEEEIMDALHANFPDQKIPARVIRFTAGNRPSHPERMAEFAPYIFAIHGKFYEMTEAPEKPGGYEDRALDYQIPFHYLKQAGWDGWVNSEYEGQRSYQDLPVEQWANEVEEVRRHHKMMAAIIGE